VAITKEAGYWSTDGCSTDRVHDFQRACRPIDLIESGLSSEAPLLSALTQSLETMVESERNLDELTEELRCVLVQTLLSPTSGRYQRVATGNLSFAELSILNVLLGHGPIRMTELSAHERVQAPTITVAIRRLEKLGPVQRSGDACDKRAVLVDITPRGLAVLRESLTSRRAALVAMLSELSESDRETLTKALAPLERLASQPASSLGLERHRDSPSLASRRGRRPQP
jgi:DNA-binding MarR family transcriptional regulator